MEPTPHHPEVIGVYLSLDLGFWGRGWSVRLCSIGYHLTPFTLSLIIEGS